MEDVGGPELVEGTELTFEVKNADDGPRATSVRRRDGTPSSSTRSSSSTSSADINDGAWDTEVYAAVDQDYQTAVYDPNQSGAGGPSSPDSDQQSSPEFCPYCGTDLSSYPDGAFCPDCGEEL
jgi:membrane protease subunit (stomatin/prohibitin family)